jgi:uncharacterized membrane protein YgcG
MRMNFVMLAVLAGLGASGAGAAEAKNLSCITGISPGEQRLLRDCAPKPQAEEEIVYVLEVMDPPPPPPPEPARMKHGESGKESGSGRDKGRDSGGGGNGGGSHGGGGGGAAHGNESAGGSSAN